MQGTLTPKAETESSLKADALDRITGDRADKELIMDIRNDLKNHIDLFGQWFGTSPTEKAVQTESNLVVAGENCCGCQTC